MQLSAVVKEYGQSLTRSERNLVDLMSARTSAPADDQFEQRIKALAAARELMAQVPDRQTTERQIRMEKAGMLKERLKVLRQMIQFLSPSAAKSLKAEMKQIAVQLASLEAESGGGSGSAMAATQTTTFDAPESGNKVETAPDRATGETGRVGDGTQPEQRGSSGSALQGIVMKGGDRNAEDRQLKETIEELKHLYKAVLAALKRKQQSGRDSGYLSAPNSHLQVYAAISVAANSIEIKV